MIPEGLDPFPWLPVTGGLLGFIVGLGFFLFSINRLLSYLSSLKQKRILLPLMLLGSLAVFSWLGWWASARFGWVFLLIFVTCLSVAYLINRRQGENYQAELAAKIEGPKPSFADPITTHALRTLYYKVQVGKKLPGSMRIVQVSDLHVNERLGMDYFRRVLDQVRSLQADILVWTGDFVSDSSKIYFLEDLLQDLPARLGSFAILGNHDYWSDPIAIARVLESAGIRVLSKRAVRVVLDDEMTLLISGCEMPWSKVPCQVEAPGNGEISLVISHSADMIHSFSQAGADLVFAGHYHAGQIQLPWIGPLVVPSIFGRRFYHGHYCVNQTHLFVSAGVGASKPYIRLYCPPDIMVVDLSSK